MAARRVVLALACAGMLSAVFWESFEAFLVWSVARVHGHAHGPGHAGYGSFEACPVVGVGSSSKAKKSAVDVRSLLLQALDLEALPKEHHVQRENLHQHLEKIAVEELNFYDGKNPARTSLVGVGDFVFDVSSTKMPLQSLLGRDISQQLPGEEVAQWESAFLTKFPVLATLEESSKATPSTSGTDPSQTVCEGTRLFSTSEVEDLDQVRQGTLLTKLNDGRVIDLSEATWLYGENGARYALEPHKDCAQLYPCLGYCCRDEDNESTDETD